MSSPAPTPPPGWYVDPRYPTQQRWWDGVRWTDYAAPGVAPTVPAPIKSTGVAYLLALLLGGLAAQFFYLRQYKQATVFLILWWVGFATSFSSSGTVQGTALFAQLVAAIMWIVSLFTIPGRVKDLNSPDAPVDSNPLPPVPGKY